MQSLTIISEDDSFPWLSQLNGYSLCTTHATAFRASMSAFPRTEEFIKERVRAVNNKIQELGIDAKAYASLTIAYGNFGQTMTSVKLQVLFKALTDQALFSLVDTDQIMLLPAN